MANSYARQASLTCPRCKQRFEAAVWLILDTAERPDLWEQARKGAFHAVACPHCGKTGPLEAPLLVYDPNATLPIVFYVPEGMPQDQARQSARELLLLLRESLGEAWRDEWLARGLQVMPGRSLAGPAGAHSDTLEPTAEERAEQAEIEALLPALRQLIDAPGWPELQTTLEQHPELLHERVDAFLAQGAERARSNGDREMAQIFEQRRAFLRRCREVGVAQTFAEREAAAQAGRANPAGFEDRRSQAEAAEGRFLDTGDLAALDQAVAGYEALTGHPGFGSSPPSTQLEIWDRIGRLHFDRYRETSTPADLDRAFKVWQVVLEVIPPRAPERAGLLNSLGMALRARHDRMGDPADLDQALQMYREALDLVPGSDHPNILNNLGSALCAFYELTNDPASLDQGIQAFRDALEATPPTSPGRATILANLGSGLAQRYDRSGSPADLEQAIQAWQQALAMVSPAAPERGSILNGLGIGLESRYTLTGKLEDIEAAIDVHREAARLAPPNAVERAARLNNLGNDLRKHYAGTGNPADLEEAIQIFDTTARLGPPDSPDRASGLDGLGSALRDRYARTGHPGDLERGVEAYREAVRLTPATASERPGRLNNLGTILYDRYLRAGSMADLQAAIEAWHAAVGGTQPSLDQAMYLTNLGMGLRLRYDREGDPADLEGAIASVRQALALTPLNAATRALTLLGLGNSTLARYRRTGERTDLEQAVDAYRQALALAPLTSPEHPLVMTALGSALGDDYVLTRDQAVLEEAIDTLSRAADLLPHTSPARSGVMNNLGSSLRDRYAQASDPKDLDRAVAAFREACEGGLLSLPEAALAGARNWGDWACERAAWPEAVQAYDFARQAVERLLATQVERAGKEAWLKDAQVLPARTAYALARTGRTGEAIVVLEHGRTRLLAEAQEGRRLDLERLPEMGRAEVYERYRTSAGRIVQLEEMAARPEALPAGFDPVAEMRSARAELDAAIQDIQKTPGYQDFFRPPGREQIGLELTAPLGAGAGPSAGVYLAVVPQGGIALIVHAGGVQAVPLDFAEAELNALLVKQQDQEIAGGYLVAQMGGTPLRPTLDDVLPLLGMKIMGPVADALTGLGLGTGSLVTLIPTGLLALLPLHAALCPADGRPACFMDRFVVAFSPSAQALHHSRAALKGPAGVSPTLFAIGNPAPLPPEFLSLAYARLEVEAIAVLFAGRAKTYYEADATLSLVERQIDDAGYLHLSCHGEFKVGDPLGSGVVLSNGEYLTIRKILARRQWTHTQLTVLSACQTAIIDFNKLPEEAIGLPAGFLQAGVPGVVGSLWSVNDLSTALLMIRFYELLLPGEGKTRQAPLSPAAALREAQTWLRDVTNENLAERFDRYRKSTASPAMAAIAKTQFSAYAQRDPDERPFAHPYHWAAFAFYGVGAALV